MNIRQIAFEYIPAATTLIELLLVRLLFAAIMLSVLITLIMLARKNLAPAARSWLWGLCVPVLFIPFEHSAVILAQSAGGPVALPESAPFQIAWLVFSTALNCILIAGIVISAVKICRRRKKTIRLLKSGKIAYCAAYYYKGRSRIYTPPNFGEAYTPDERGMLLAHEKQHVLQRDTLLYPFLQAVQCVFWFNPLVHMAVRLIRQDRELLCDERVTLNCPKHAYGMLLLSEAQKPFCNHAIAGAASEQAGMYERVAACVKPFPKDKKAAVVVACIAAVVFAAGCIGFTQPIVNAPMDIQVSLIDAGDNGFSPQFNGAEKFVLVEQDGIYINQEGLFEYAVSAGLTPEQRLSVRVIEAKRQTLTSCYTVSNGGWFAVSELNSEELFFPFHDAGFNLWSVLFKVI